MSVRAGLFSGRLAAAVAAVPTIVVLAGASPALAVDDGPFADPLKADTLMQAAAAPPTGLQETIAFSGLTNPMATRFAPDGRVFVAEKSGLIKVFDGLGDPTPTIFADLRPQVHDFWDRGMESMELDPNFAVNGRVYVLYTRNEEPFSTTNPRWANDGCPTPPGPTADGCVVTGTLSRLDANGNETPLIAKDFCQQYASHSVGGIAFGADGMLYLSAGDGASFNFADYGQDGSPLNPCGDPPGGVGATLTPPTAEGGALRAQDLRTSGDPAGLNGSVLRVDPATGNGAPGNPLAASSDANARRIVAQGLRNPYRITMRPGTNEVWIGDVGWNEYEEINRIASPTAGITNFGWPCYEGPGRQGGYDALGLNICENLYDQSSAYTGPYFTYSHAAKVVPGESCPTGSSSISGLDFYTSGSFPDRYDGALFFADYTRDCIWVMPKGSNGLPDPSARETFVAGAANPVDIQIGPGGDLYYADFDGGTIRRVRWPNAAPTARASASPVAGQAPLNVSFDASDSTDPDADTLTYAWDLDADGAFDDSTAKTPSFTYTATGVYLAQLRVRDPGGLEDVTTVRISVGAPPTVAMSTPSASTTWTVGDTIAFSGSARDRNGNALVPVWRLNLRHCSRLDATNCHTHEMQTFTGNSGQFTAPDHEYPSYLELTLEATDELGLTSSVTRRLDPNTVALRFEADQAGARLGVGSDAEAAPFTRTVIVGSSNSISAPSPQIVGQSRYTFASWSDGGNQSHNVVAGATPTTYRASFTVSPADPTLVAAYAFDEGQGATLGDGSERANDGAISGATWTASGKSGGALSFDGINDTVAVPDSASLDLTTGMTVMAWVRPTDVGPAWRTVLLKEQAQGLAYSLYATEDRGRPSTYIVAGGDANADGTAALAPNAWTHLAATYDGSTLRLFVNGSEVSARARTGSIMTTTGALRIGGNNVWGEYFAGLIDDLRVYNRALPATSVVADMNTPVGPAQPVPPTLAVSPTSLSFSAVAGGAEPAGQDVTVTNTGGGSLSWTATDNQAWLEVSPASGSAPGTARVTARTSGLAAGTYTGAVTVSASGAQGTPKQIPVTFTVAAAPPPPQLSTSPSSLAFTATAGGANPATQSIAVTNTGGGSLSWTASAAATWLSASPATGSAPGTVTVSVNTAGLAPGTYTSLVQVTSTGTAGSPRATPVTLTVNPAPTGGIVAAYGFEEASGTGVTDRSGQGNAGTIDGATRVTSGRFGAALRFDGVNDSVGVPDANSLDLTTGMTAMGWVNPSALSGAWRTVLLKEWTSLSLAYGIYASGDTLRPSAWLSTATADRFVIGTAAVPLNAWTNLASTYDGSNLRLYVNGTLVATRAGTGAIATSNLPLRIGGNSLWGEWFNGMIDEIRLYDRSLSASEIQAAMTTPVG